MYHIWYIPFVYCPFFADNFRTTQNVDTKLRIFEISIKFRV